MKTKFDTHYNRANIALGMALAELDASVNLSPNEYSAAMIRQTAAKLQADMQWLNREIEAEWEGEE